MKIKNNIPAGFYFQESNRSYFMDGKKMTGVTTVLGVLAKPALISWAAKMATEYITEHCEIEPEHGRYLVSADDLEQAKKAHASKKDKAADIGTLVHGAVEQWIKNGTIPALNEDGMKMFNHFLKWAEGKKFLASEQRVYSTVHFYAGTFDFLVEIDGKKYIGDLKTSNGIYGREYFAQTAGYRIAIEEMGILDDLHGSVIVRCGKKGDFEEQYSYDYETDKEMFLSCLKLYRIINNY